jgi:hypothetical protein
VLAKSNRNGPAWSSVEWDDATVKMLLSNLGLPVDAELSVVCVELMPHFGSFVREAQPVTSTAAVRQDSLTDAVFAMRGNTGAPGVPGTPAQPSFVRPLTHHLGHFRLLRTSPLTPVPEVC